MLPSELLISRKIGEAIIPKKLAINEQILNISRDYIVCFTSHLGKTQQEINQRLSQLEGDSPNYRVKRGLAHILKSSFANFEVVSPIDPQALRQKVFQAAGKTLSIPDQREYTLEKVADNLSKELKRSVSKFEIEQGLYADLRENKQLTEFIAPKPTELIHRFNLSQVQGIFYRASNIIINAHRNDPGEYKLLFRYLKLFQLMAYIEGDADTGFTITIDGASSLFKPSTRYGLALAKMIPALLHVTKWSLSAQLQNKDPYSGAIKVERFSLDSDRCDLVSHYPQGKPYDSMLEESFVKSWEKTKTQWQLEREVDLVPLPGSVMIPDFRLVHPNGKAYLLEIVGYWRPEYLQKKFYQVQTSGVTNLVLAISERLNLEKAGVNFQDLPNRVVWFKNKLQAKAIIEVLSDS